MIEEYDFSKAQKGKFYSSDANLNIPLYLDQEVKAFVKAIVKRKGADLSTVTSHLLRWSMKLAEAMK